MPPSGSCAGSPRLQHRVAHCSSWRIAEECSIFHYQRNTTTKDRERAVPNDFRRESSGGNLTECLHYFLPLLRPFFRSLWWAGLAMLLDAALTVLRPWPLKVVIDRVLS